MAQTSEVYDVWVDERLALLNSNPEWQPGTSRALVRLRERTESARRRSRRLRWFAATVAVGTVVCIGLVEIPAPRAFAQYCLDCSAVLWQTLSNPGPVRAELKPEASRRPAPDFTLTDETGKPLRLSDYRGKVVLLNFWATWCGGCQAEIPWMVDFHNKYKERGLVIIGVSMDDDGWKSVRPFMEEKKMNYSVVIGNDNMRKLYTLGYMPKTFMIDQSGRIAAIHVGALSKQRYEAEIEMLLRKESGPTALDEHSGPATTVASK